MILSFDVALLKPWGCVALGAALALACVLTRACAARPQAYKYISELWCATPLADAGGEA